MYLLKRELKANRKSLLIWIIGCSLMMTLSLSMFPSFASQGAELEELMATFPEEMLKAINADKLDFSNPVEYFGYIYQYILLAAGIMSMLIGISALAKEEGEKTIEFLFAKPVTRSQIVIEKALYLLLHITIFSVIIMMVPFAVLNIVADETINFTPFLYTGIATWLTQLFFMSVGVCLSTLVVKAKRYMQVALGVVFTFYFVSMIAGIMQDMEWLKYVSPFSYFNVSQIISTEQLTDYGIWIACIGSGVLVATTFLLYNRKDYSN